MGSARRVTSAAGRWSATHPLLAIAAWVLGVAILLIAGRAVGTQKVQDADMAVGESGRAQRAIVSNFDEHASEYVLFTSKALTAASPEFRAAIRDVVTGIEATGKVENVQSPLDPANAQQISASGHAALVQFQIPGDSAAAVKRVTAVSAAVRAAAAAHPQLQIAESGDASISKAVDDTVLRDLHRAEGLSFPLTLVILLVAFGALVAALVPLGLAVLAILAANGLVAFTSHLSGVSMQASSVMLLIGLAVGVDYSMFYVKRQREERARGQTVSAAIDAAAATSGRSVLVSGLTVLTAMAGLFLTGSKIFIGMGQATMLVVAVAVLGSLTLLPALLALLADRIDRGRLPLVGRFRRPADQSRLWGALLDRTLRRPAITAVLSAGVLLLLASPALRIHTAMPSATDLPHNVTALATYDRIQQVFPGGGAPAVVVVQARDVTAPAVRAAIATFERAALATRQMNQPISMLVNPARDTAIIRVPLAGNGEDAASTRALSALRQDVIPATLARAPGVTVGVTGMTASNEDFNALMRDRSPWVFAFVLLLAFVVLLVSYRSLVIPVTAVILNLMSVAAAYGVIVALFQWGWGESLLSFTSVHAVTSWLPLFLFVVLFGLSMDYHVFILSRIRETYDRIQHTDEAISHGIKSTAGVVTAAAVVMVFVFLTVATLSMVSIKAMGVGLAVAVLLDATIVRALLLPATMKLLGQRNWYLPRWLEWLPEVSRSVPPAPEPASAPQLVTTGRRSG
jgi:uncharacterized membrane protein YdfJ with MMPL/SSD domain